MGFNYALFTVPIATVLAYVPHVVRAVVLRKNKAYNNVDPRAYDEQRKELTETQTALVSRMVGAHNNQLETLGVYAAGVVANVALHRNDWVVNTFSSLYIGMRAAYIAAYATQAGGGYVRTGCFFGSISSIFTLWIRAIVL